jgi:hypothetical protein
LILRKGYNFFGKGQLNLSVYDDQIEAFRVYPNLNLSIITENTNKQTDYIGLSKPSTSIYFNIEKLNKANGDYTIFNQKIVLSSEQFLNYEINDIKYLSFGSFNIKASLYVYDKLNSVHQKNIIVQNYNNIQFESKYY